MGVEYKQYLFLDGKEPLTVTDAKTLIRIFLNEGIIDCDEIIMNVNVIPEDMFYSRRPGDGFTYNYNVNKFINENLKFDDLRDFSIEINYPNKSDGIVRKIFSQNYFDFDEPYIHRLHIVSSIYSVFPTSEALIDIMDHTNSVSMFPGLSCTSEITGIIEKNIIDRFQIKNDQKLIYSTQPEFYHRPYYSDETPGYIITAQNAYSGEEKIFNYKPCKKAICIDLNKSTPNCDNVRVLEEFKDIMGKAGITVSMEFSGWN